MTLLIPQRTSFTLLLTATLALSLAATFAEAQTAPKYSAKVPPYITTPDKVETSIGTAKPSGWVAANRASNGPVKPAQIAPWW